MQQTLKSQARNKRIVAGCLRYISLALTMIIALKIGSGHHLFASSPIDPDNPPGGLFENSHHHAAATATSPVASSSRPRIVPHKSDGDADLLIRPQKEQTGFFAAPLARIEKPLITPSEKTNFDELFAPDIKQAKGSLTTMVNMSKRLSSAASIPGLGVRMKRYLSLQAMQLALQGDASETTLQQQMQTLLPQLGEPTLAVADVRASLLTAMARSHAKTTSPLLLRLTCSAWINLAVLQVRSGHWASAGNSVKQAKYWFGELSPKERSPQLVGDLRRVSQWVNFAEQAAILWPRLTYSYQLNPAGKASDTLALYALALLQDPWQAAHFAAESHTLQIKAMALAFGHLPEQLQPTSPGSVKSLLAAAKAIAAVVPLADNSAERDAIMEYARRKLAELALNKNASKADVAAAAQTIHKLSKRSP
ncbi:MAG: hypothetical protein HKL96_05185 [Phycisphaerales bacterium]|nr:hypothetical protein [Phycisphaerales bacterium]